MRRINIRKRKREHNRNINIKSIKFIYLLVAIILLCILIYLFYIKNVFIKSNFENDTLSFSELNSDIPFSIKKITLFSSATSSNNTIINQSLVKMNISQYSDICIYLDNLYNDNSKINSLYIDNINISSPKVGKTYLYKKQMNDMGTCSFSESTIIENNFCYNIIDTDSDIDYLNYELYNDGSTPICLGFYNKDIKEDFLTESSEIVHNGTLLKKANISLSDINCNVSFRINIIANNDEHYVCNVNFDIPFEYENESILNTGYITKEINAIESNAFIRIKK